MLVPRRRRGFSLLELILVIGIITFLIALLMPMISASRAAAKRVQCAAGLHAIGQAAVLHATEHQGYLPVGGWHWAPEGGIADAQGLGDPLAARYTYYDEDGLRRPAPVSVALAAAVGLARRLDSRAGVEQEIQSEPVRRMFRCPSQYEPLRGLTQKEDGMGWTAPRDWSSYVFNEAILGRREKEPYRPEPPMGHLTAIRNSSAVMFAMDGRPRDQGFDNWLMIPDKYTEETAYDFKVRMLTPGSGYGRQLFDYLRHNWRMNVLFVDGHVETVPMTDAGLATVGTSKGVY